MGGKKSSPICVNGSFFATFKSGKTTLSMVGNDSLPAIKKNKLFSKNILSPGPSKSFVSLHIGLSIGALQGAWKGGGLQHRVPQTFIFQTSISKFSINIFSVRIDYFLHDIFKLLWFIVPFPPWCFSSPSSS